MTPPALIPQPTECEFGDGVFTLTGATGLHAPAPIADLVRELLSPATGFGFLAGAGGIELIETEDVRLGAEGYRLTVEPTGVRAEGSLAGLRWAVQTIRQLLPAEIFSAERSAAVTWSMPCVEILDVPRLAWRGSMLDVGRWFQPIEYLHRYVDLMAMHKLNRFHLHLTEDQGWRFEVKAHPRLTEVGAWRRESMAGHYRDSRYDGAPHGGFYTQQELRDLVAYAARRGVEIMPEIDLPGHMQAAIAAYPHLGNNPDTQLDVATIWGVSEKILNTEPGTVEFVRDVLDEVVDVFPFEYIHIGGDEVPTTEWAANPRARSHASAEGFDDVSGLLGWWGRIGAEHLAGHGRRSAVWDEMLEAGAPKDALMFAWRGLDRVEASVNAGFDVIACPHEQTYLDYPEAAGLGEPLAIRSDVTSLSDVYGYRPANVHGIAGQVWTEYMPTPELIEYRAFPRLTAIAESGWSHDADYPGFRERLTTHLARLDALGVGYRSLDR